MKIEKLLFRGGVKVSGNLRDGEPFSISRLSSEGETRISYPGIDLDYNVDGKLILAVIKLVKFTQAQPGEQMAKMTADFWTTLGVLNGSDTEVAAEVDLLKKQVEIILYNRFGRNRIESFDLVYFNGAFMPVEVGDEDGIIGTLGFQIEEVDGQVKLGVGSEKIVMWVAQPVEVETGLLGEGLDINGVNNFLKGRKDRKKC